MKTAAPHLTRTELAELFLMVTHVAEPEQLPGGGYGYVSIPEIKWEKLTAFQAHYDDCEDCQARLVALQMG